MMHISKDQRLQTRRVQSLVLSLLALLILLAPAVQARSVADRHIAIELVPESISPAAGGEVTVALVSRQQPGWHGYWRNPSDAGIETQAVWALPKGMSAGPIQYPVPHKQLVGGLMNHIYDGPFVQIVTLRLPEGLAAGARLPSR
jgi:DsbC/DsbD-like thiol-disulfide interchange protein